MINPPAIRKRYRIETRTDAVEIELRMVFRTHGLDQYHTARGIIDS